jgi:ubiquinone/menaquinone biosynthesis C-methylase UbiE
MTLTRDPEGHETDWIHEFIDFRGKRVLEIGAGSGRLTWRYADAVQHSVGVDLDEEYLNFAPRECPPELRSVAAWAQADAARLPFARGKFDLAVLAWSL